MTQRAIQDYTTITLGVGGSLIAQDTINTTFLLSLKKTLARFPTKKFVIVIGGGKTARTYMNALAATHSPQNDRARLGMIITRLNAKLTASILKANKKLPTTLKDVHNLLKKHKVIVTGALRFEKNSTSDGTAAEIARNLKTPFINMTNVNGLYTKDPRAHPDAQLIPRITARDFHAIITRHRYVPGQHHVLDHRASRIITKAKVPTYIISGNLSNLRRLLTGKKFTGTTLTF